MKIERQAKPDIIIGMRVTIGQVIMSLVNGGIFWYNWGNPEPLPGEVVGMIAQPLIFVVQILWANYRGITT
jgi:hypothetical protein